MKPIIFGFSLAALALGCNQKAANTKSTSGFPAVDESGPPVKWTSSVDPKELPNFEIEIPGYVGDVPQAKSSNPTRFSIRAKES